jgi:hypothetical protein
MNVSSSVDKTVAGLRNQPSAGSADCTPTSRKSIRLHSKSARKATESYSNVNMFQNIRSWRVSIICICFTLCNLKTCFTRPSVQCSVNPPHLVVHQSPDS